MYSNQMDEIALTVGTATLDFTSTGDKARYSPALNPVYIRGLAIQSNATPGDVGVVKLDKRPVFSSDAGRGDGDVGVVNITTAHVQGKVVYKYFTPVKISPGEEVVLEVTDASAALNGVKAVLLVTPSWEIPGNITPMVLST